MWIYLGIDEWPAIASAIRGPWPPEAVRVDLEWWDLRVDTGRIAGRPGRRKLAARWGWTVARAREAMRQWDEP